MKHFEFWHPRLFELPYYLYLLLASSIRGLSIKSLARADYALDHGEIGIGSKYKTQLAFDQQQFLPTGFLSVELSHEEKRNTVETFASEHGYPVVLKSDIGSVGKGVVKVNSPDEIGPRVLQLVGPYLVQKFTAWNYEYGVFYVRHRGEARITGINKKHFPTVVGDGQKDILKLAQQHPRYSDHWATFLQYQDVNRVPLPGEKVQLSFIGSHTMGCRFTDDTHLLTPEIEESVFSIFERQPGFNFGRLDVKAQSESAFLQGNFVVIEVNGVASLPTNMFDPNNSLRQAYRIFLRHGRYLVESAAENRHEPMELDSYRSIIRRVRKNARLLNSSHQRLMR
jgi:hypothetical protein